MRLVKQLVAVSVVAFAGGQVVAAQQGNSQVVAALGTGTAVLALLVYAWVVRRTEHRAVTEVAPSGIVTGLVPGVILGTGVFAAVIGGIALLGGYRVTGWGSADGLAGVAGFMAAAAVTEELLFRGVLFRIIEERAGTWLALLLSGLVFGLMHLLNPNATLGSALAIGAEAGGMLGAAYVATRRLWVPIGLHAGWNFAEGGIFGAAVSGRASTAGLLKGQMAGSPVLTGGSFGPEASLMALGICLLVTVLFLWRASQRGRLVPRRSWPRTARSEAVTLAR